MAKIPSDDPRGELAALKAQLAALQAQNEALTARQSGKPGFYPRTIKALTAEKIAAGAKAGRFHADRILTGGVTVSLYVGGNGKLTIGGHYNTRGVTAWAGDREVVLSYMRDNGPDGFAADLDRVAATGKWGNGIG